MFDFRDTRAIIVAQAGNIICYCGSAKQSYSYDVGYYGNTCFSTVRHSKATWSIKLTTSDEVREMTKSIVNLYIIISQLAAARTREVCTFGKLYLTFFLEQSIHTPIGSDDAVWPKNVPIGGVKSRSTVEIPKTCQFMDSVWEFPAEFNNIGIIFERWNRRLILTEPCTNSGQCLSGSRRSCGRNRTSAIKDHLKLLL